MAVAACGNSGDRPDKTAKTAPEGTGSGSATTQPKLKVVLDGRPVAMTSAVMVRWGDDSLELDVGNHEISCTEALQEGRVGVPADDVHFSAHVERRLGKDGAFSWVLAKVSSDISFGMNEERPTTVTGDIATKPEIALDFELDASANSSGKWKHIAVHGVVAPKSCGARPIEPTHPAIAKATHPSDATITVAGAKLPIVSAWRFKKMIYLSSEPITCAYAGLPTRVSLAIDNYDDKDRVSYQMEGAWTQLHANGGNHDLKIKPAKTGTGADGPTIELGLSGSSTIDGYKVELAGTIEALDCKERR